jgi:guanosine-3',5'-bis(diphosphate) 3'-pyrophosphohydrolase
MKIKNHTKTIEEKDNKLIVNAYRKLLRHSKLIISKSDSLNIKKAFRISLEAHKDMRRKSGEPYILHPISVAQICIEEIGLGATSIIAALLHDVVEDTDLSLDYIESEFGTNVSRICDGLTKISQVFTPGSSIQSENFKKMLLTLVDDMRVILIKLADRLHNMRTLHSMSRKSQLKISSETIYVYSPLAHRLGLYSIKSELDDLYLKYTDEKNFNFIKNKLNDSKEVRAKFIRSFIRPINNKLKTLNYKVKIIGRPKSIFSINNKIKYQDKSFEDIYDLFAIRIIVDVGINEEKNICWQVYSIVTDFYQPNPDRLKDWISTPKANGYESLHTTVMSNVGKWVEVQIRSKRMDDIAEKGFAAHWKYKEQLKGDSRFDDWISSVKDLISNKNYSPQEFLDDFRGNLYNEEIFVFTPNGDLITLPLHSTVLDFAYSIHSEIGSKSTGAIIDKVLFPLNHRLKSGDQVNIITSTKQKASEDWLNKVVTSKARSSIKSSLIREEKHLSSQGKDLIKRKFKQLKLEYDQNISKVANYFNYKSIVEFYYDIAKGVFNLKKIREYLNFLDKSKLEEKKIISKVKLDKTTFDNKEITKALILFDENNQTLDYSISTCCNPIPGDDIFGFVTINEGIKVHRINCSNSPELFSKYAYRVTKAEWFTKINNNLVASLVVNGTDRIGVLDDITKIISKQLKVNMKSISISMNDGIFEGKIELFVADTMQLFKLIEKLKKIKNLVGIKRVD